MNRRGFFKLFAAAAPAILLARDFHLPVSELILPTGPTSGIPLVGLQDLTARMATILAQHFEGLPPVVDLRYPHLGLTHGDVMLRHKSSVQVGLSPGCAVEVDKRWLEPAALALVQSMKHDGATQLWTPEIPYTAADVAVVSLGGIAVRGVSEHDLLSGIVLTRFDVLYG